ncbi:MAG TPA: energy transducer TonB [Chitinophagaceae bacterium]|nr:energy transducer TonB [Chitinophagaceae bacterium]
MMKKITTILSATLLCLVVFAQQTEFEGIMNFRVEVQSKNELISNKALMNMLAMGNTMTTMIKHGNYRQISGISDSYFITKDQKEYIKFKGVDTLYYFEYDFDTTAVTKVSRSDEKRTIAGIDCKLITIESGGDSKKYYYAPSLYINPEYDKNNTSGRYDAFVKETSSLYLGLYEESKSFSLSHTCTRVEKVPVNDSVFKLPDLPQKKFSYNDLTTPPEFTRAGGWEKYLLANLNGQVASKYLKLPKGEEIASQQVMVRFMVNEYGRVVSAEVVNKKEVHPKLAEEALRVVNESPTWKPAKFFEENVIFWLQAPITFEVSKK